MSKGKELSLFHRTIERVGLVPQFILKLLKGVAAAILIFLLAITSFILFIKYKIVNPKGNMKSEA